jgi:hypothetical protein
MVFRRELLRELGGFDEALDTGAPLPGGGDLDAFYRVLNAGRALVHEPRMLVFHQHRSEHAALRRQMWSWGLGLMAYVQKWSDREGAHRQRFRNASLMGHRSPQETGVYLHVLPQRPQAAVQALPLGEHP